MGIIDQSQVKLPSPGRFADASFGGRYNFLTLARRVEQSVHLVEKPLAYARTLQRLRQPTWYLEYFDHPGCRAFRQGMCEAIARLGGKLVYHSHFQRYEPDPASMALRWHTHGRKSRVFHYKEAYLPHMTQLDCDGYSGWSEIGTDKKSIKQEYPEPSIANDFFVSRIVPFLKERVTKYTQSKEPFDHEPGYVFVAMQMINDAVIEHKFEKNYISSMHNIIKYLSEKNLRIIIKRHPNCRAEEMANSLRSLVDAGMAIETTSSIHDIIPGARAVVTLNSGVGFESLLYEKPVVCLGRSDYGDATFTLRDTRSSEVEMGKAHEFIMRGQAPEGLRQHLFVMLTKYQVDCREDSAFDRAALRMLCLYHLDNPMTL